MITQEIHNTLQKLADTEKSKILQGFFKTGPGEYGDGDILLGITVPALRKLSKEYEDISLRDAVRLLKSLIHEERLLALLILVRRFVSGNDARKKHIYDLYLKNTNCINNWDLVDVSAPNIVGTYLMSRSRKPLYELAKSRDLWKRRISIIATFPFIRQNDYQDTQKVATMLIQDDHDLIHKAVGWMLREIGKRDLQAEERFLKRHYQHMPRTMLRYAIERFPEAKRLQYLKGKVQTRS